MNDPTYLEAARKLAERVMVSSATTPEAKITHAFRVAVSRQPTKSEIQLALRLYHQRLTKYQQDAAAAKALLSIGDSPREAGLNDPELAAWTSVMSVLLNLDEAITKS